MPSSWLLKASIGEENLVRTEAEESGEKIISPAIPEEGEQDR